MSAFEERTSGGIEIELQSRVDLYYGDSIRQQVRDVLHALGVEHAPRRDCRRRRAAVRDRRANRGGRAPRRSGQRQSRRCRKRLRCRRPRPKTGCAARGCIFRAMSRSTSSTPDCTRRTRSFSIWKTRSTTPKKTRRGCWCAMRCARWISARPSAWFASISCRSGWQTWKRSFRRRPDLILIPKVETPAAGI